tara:strand:- start:182 stop:817 length:636 start_codon:yes stop_codon:yes gene_type:complete
MNDSTKDRIIKLGEVKTPEPIVKNILDLLGDLNYKSRYFEPGCGDGNFLLEILSRKIDEIFEMKETKEYVKNKYFENIEIKIFLAISSIYGVDIDAQNINDCRLRLKNFIKDEYKKRLKSDVPDYFLNIINNVLSKNIILGNILLDENNIVICEYSLLPANRIQIREFDFNELLYPDNEIFRDDLKLFGHIPEVKKTHDPVNFKDLWKNKK